MAQSTLVVMPTGTGKTVCLGQIVSQWPSGRVMVIAHREELIGQLSRTISLMSGETCGVEMAEESVYEGSYWRPRVVVASVQTLNSRRGGKKRLEKFDPQEFGLVVTDEAHHGVARSYRGIYDWFYKNPVVKHIGVTATPDRADEEALGQIYETVAFEYGILDAVNDGWLVPIKQQFVHVESLDLSDCKSHKNDLKDVDVARVMELESNLHKVVYPTIELAMDRPTLIFAASVAHAHHMAEILNRHKPASAVAIDGTTDRELRRAQLSAFSGGQFQFRVNCAVFLEGFDAPRISCVAMARPTASRALYSQAIGRGTRPLPGVVDPWPTAGDRRHAIAASGKQDMLVLDFVGNSGKHKLVCTADILGGNESDQVLAAAVAAAKRRGKPVNMAEEIEEAKEEIERKMAEKQRLEAALAAKRAALAPKARYSVKTISPFDVFDVVPQREPGYHKGRKATPGQLAALAKFKVGESVLAGLSFWQAGQMLNVLVGRIKEDKCTLKQAAILKRHGFDPNSSFTDARKLIDKIVDSKWTLFNNQRR
jgi:superfamily II DNA or RNA helicase